jgi:NAD(P)-dependent dehydrogenase (short-subunit alcohol dehydrogenase family)
MDSVCVVTGISAGIGKAAAMAMAQRGIQVVGVVRDAERGRAAVQDIRDRVPAAKVDLLVADLSALDEVRELAEQIRTRYDQRDVVLRNAGVAVSPGDDGGRVRAHVRHESSGSLLADPAAARPTRDRRQQAGAGGQRVVGGASAGAPDPVG